MLKSSPVVPHGSNKEYPVLSVQSRAAVARLRTSLLLPNARRSDLRIVFRKNMLGANTRQVERRVNDLYSDCGCQTGGLAVIFAIGGLAAWWYFSQATFNGSSVKFALAVIAGAAVLGKLFGLVLSRMTLFWILLHIERAADVQEKEVT